MGAEIHLKDTNSLYLQYLFQYCIQDSPQPWSLVMAGSMLDGMEPVRPSVGSEQRRALPWSVHVRSG